MLILSSTSIGVMASRKRPSSSKPEDPFSSSASYLTPLSRSKHNTMSSDSLELNNSNSSARNLKFLPVILLDSLFQREGFALDKLIFPIDALKLCLLLFPQTLLDLFNFVRLAPCQISLKAYIILAAIFCSQERTHLGLLRLSIVDYIGSHTFIPVSEAFPLFFWIVPCGDLDFA